MNEGPGGRTPARPSISRPGARHLALLRLAAQLPVELGALREARGAEGMTLRDEPARGVHHQLPAVGVRARVHELAALALGAEAEPFVGDELVAREAVVQLHHVHFLRAETRLLV